MTNFKLKDLEQILADTRDALEQNETEWLRGIVSPAVYVKQKKILLGQEKQLETNLNQLKDTTN